MERVVGKVLWWRKTYGFARVRDRGQDVFIHHSALLCKGPLVAGDRVQFTIEPSPKGDRAVDVELLEGVGELQKPKEQRHGGRRPESLNARGIR